MTGKPGRPAFILTPELAKKIVELVRSHAPRELAAEASGISVPLLGKWITLGRRGVEPYAEFYREIKMADAEREARLAGQIVEDKSWQAKAWHLAVLNPKRWAKDKEKSEKAEARKQQAQFDAAVDAAVQEELKRRGIK